MAGSARSRFTAGAALVVVLTLTLAACADDGSSGQQGQPAGDSTGAGTPTDVLTPSVPASASTGASTPGVRNMLMSLTVGDIELFGRLDDSPTARDFAELLPLTVRLTDFHSAEKISDLPRRLKVDGSPKGTDARAGDIAYYAPWGNLALFYRDAPYADGLVLLGRFDEGAVKVLGSLKDNVDGVLSLTRP